MFVDWARTLSICFCHFLKYKETKLLFNNWPLFYLARFQCKQIVNKKWFGAARFEMRMLRACGAYSFDGAFAFHSGAATARLASWTWQIAVDTGAQCVPVHVSS